MSGHKYSASSSQNHKAQLANAYNELGKELSSSKIRVVGNYTLGKVIGEGTYGKVRLGTHRLTSTRVAIKQIPKAMSAALTREIHHHRRLHHPHVTQLYEVIATESNIWLVTELCSGGELFDYLAEKGRLAEPEARAIFGQLCLAVGYIHEKGVVHRDLKLENVLLDERCRVKLGDFGFTREYERGSLLDTYCGTTGYAAPEMLLGKKYLGPEVDIWSLGIILYCLLTGTLPFDDDDESVMREKIIIGIFDIPDWLSLDARDLLRNILQYDPSKRLSIQQILAQPWFSYVASSSMTLNTSTLAPAAEESQVDVANVINQALAPPSPSASESSFQTASSELPQSQATQAQGAKREFGPGNDATIRREPSESTIKKGKGREKDKDKGSNTVLVERETRYRSPKPQGNNDVEESHTEPDRPVPPLSSMSSNFPRSRDPSPSPSRPVALSSSGTSVQPPQFPTRTPARTKRRSISSILSVPASPGPEVSAAPPIQDYADLLRTPAPLLFSTPIERSLLNNLSALGFDIGQMVHAVLSDACDASGAVWWMLKRKAERKAWEEALKQTSLQVTANVSEGKGTETGTETEVEPLGVDQAAPSTTLALIESPSTLSPSDTQANEAVVRDQSNSAPELAFVPPTPTVPTTQRPKNVSPPVTPPRSRSPRELLSPTPTLTSGETNSQAHSIYSKSSPSTPSNSLRDKDREPSKGKEGKGNGKPRAGSVSIMQRATTALEAAGLVRKKSTEGVRDDKDRKEEKDKDEKSIGRNGHGNSHTPARLTKSPPTRAVRDAAPPMPATPEQEREINAAHLPTASPWIVPITRASTFNATPSAALTPSTTPGDGSPATHANGESNVKAHGPSRNRTSILSTFRTWFNDDRKGKRKAAASPPLASSSVPSHSSNMSPTSPTMVRRGSTTKRRGAWSGQRPRAKRASISSHRSSSVNSRRSSVTSMQMVVLESPHTVQHQGHGIGLGMESISRQRSDPSRRSFTPNSEFERAGEYSSRPSSIRSYSMQNRHSQGHKKSPSASSIGSAARLNRAASPLQKYHRRAGSGSSTRVVRQSRPSQSIQPRPTHGRSNSTTSSIHSLQSSSRPGSFYDASEGEGQRTGSPLPQTRSRRSLEETPRRGAYNTVLIAHKKQTPFGGPSAYSTPPISRLSWKKAWGTEPPGWQSRPTQYPVEVLAILPGTDQSSSIRDVFTGRQSFNLGDEDDWVDEDDDIPAFSGGLGQNPTTNSSLKHTHESPMMLSPPPCGKTRNNKKIVSRNSNNLAPRNAAGRGNARTKPGHSPTVGSMPLPGGDGVFDSSSEVPESRMNRRQLPTGRPGPAFKHPIQEEDEDEE